MRRSRSAGSPPSVSVATEFATKQGPPDANEMPARDEEHASRWTLWSLPVLHDRSRLPWRSSGASFGRQGGAGADELITAALHKVTGSTCDKAHAAAEESAAEATDAAAEFASRAPS